MEARNKKIIIISVAGTIAAAAIFLVVRNMSKRKQLEKKLAASSEDVLKNIPETPDEEVIAWPLKLGSGYLNQTESNAVKIVQRALNAIITRSYVYQRLKLLEEDGKFGNSTLTTLSTIVGVKEVSYELWSNMYDYLDANAPAEQTNVFTSGEYTEAGQKVTFGDIIKSYFSNLF